MIPSSVYSPLFSSLSSSFVLESEHAAFVGSGQVGSLGQVGSVASFGSGQTGHDGLLAFGQT